MSSSRDGKPELYSMDIKGGNVIKLSSSHGIEVSPSVSPDGKQIVFVVGQGRQSAALYNEEGRFRGKEADL